MHFSFAAFAHGDFLDSIGETIRVMMAVGVQQDLKRHSEISGCLTSLVCRATVAGLVVAAHAY